MCNTYDVSKVPYPIFQENCICEHQILAWMNLDLKYWNSVILFAGLSGDEFKFNKSTGDGPARYNIIHYKQVSVGKYDWVTVGDFHDGDIFLNMSGKSILRWIFLFL